MDKYKTLEEFYASQSGDKKVQVEELRNIIMSANPQLEETLKWNAPNFVYDSQDRLTMNLMNKEGKVKLVLHMGATKQEDKRAQSVMNDPTGLISWNSDIRGTITFESSQHLNQVRNQLTELVCEWLRLNV
ncbi:MAG: DUF1801 domain-containing protein [Chloroflexota bacterium]